MIDKKKGSLGVDSVITGGLKPPVAGAGSKVKAADPVYRNASGYRVEENVNGGMGGGKKGKVAEGGGQTSYDASAKNDLVGQSDYQKDPYRAKASEFTPNKVTAGNDQSGRSHGFSEGHNQLISQPKGARHCEDDGDGTPVPSDRSRVVAAAFPIEVNAGEGNSDTGEIGLVQMVDLQTGHIVGGDTGKTGYVPQFNVSVGAPPSRNMSAGKVGQKR